MTSTHQRLHRRPHFLSNWRLLAVLTLSTLLALSATGCDRLGSGQTPADCATHDLERCPLCDTTLVEALGMCAEHGVPEALCSSCRPALEAAFRLERDWCGGHGVPESQCGLCNPGVEFDATAAAAGHGNEPVPDVASSPEAPSSPDVPAAPEAHSSPDVLSSSGAFASPDDLAPSDVTVVTNAVPRSERPPAPSCETERSMIRFASDHVADAVGLEYRALSRQPLQASLWAPARIGYDARRHARLGSRTPGVVREVRVDLGAVVEQGDVLLLVESPQLGAARAALRQAQARFELWTTHAEREDQLLEDGLTTAKDALQARTNLEECRIALDTAEQSLRLLGVEADTGTDTLSMDGIEADLPIRAPFAGQVVGLSAAVGEPVSSERELVEIADTARMWATLDLPPADVHLLSLGAPVQLTLQGAADRSVGGTVTWIAPVIDARTRTVMVRAEFDNHADLMRSGGFGQARIITRHGEPALLVPKEAVQWEGCCNVAFVRRTASEFEPRKLLLGHDTGDAFEVMQGLSAGDVVVTTGSFLLRTELQKGSIGAGCCDVDYLGG
jgi:cobalt-zinc-cadmium efflux system membrane fusion protein